MPDITVKGRKYSSQMKEYVEYESKVRSILYSSHLHDKRTLYHSDENH